LNRRGREGFQREARFAMDCRLLRALALLGWAALGESADAERRAVSVASQVGGVKSVKNDMRLK